MEPKNELQRNAIAEARRKELDSYQRALDIQWLNSRMEDGRMGRCLALIQREAEMEKDFQERTDHAAIVNARAEQEAKLGMEITKIRNEEVNELMRRHYLRERDPSLRELQKKLQAGYVCRDLKQQILHNEYKRLQDKVEESQANRVLLNALYNDLEQMECEEKSKMETTSAYRKDLQQQLVNKQRQQQCQYEDTLVERKMQEGIMKTIADEDQRELQHKRDLTEKMRKEMVTFQRARQAWKQKQKEMVVVEERKIEEQRRAASDRSSAILAERERQMLLREEQVKKIGQKILADTAAIQERSDIIRRLQEQEYLEKNAEHEVSERRKAESYRLKAAADREEALRRRAEASQRRSQEDARYRRLAEEQKKMEDEKERQKELTKMQKNKQYSMDLCKQIADNARRRQADRDLEQKRAQDQFGYDAAWRSEVSEERKKVIEEHVPKLLGYLQAGVIKHDDLPAVKAGVDKGDFKLDIDSLAVSNRPHRFPKCNDQCRILREY